MSARKPRKCVLFAIAGRELRPVNERTYGDGTTADEIWRLHAADRPDCNCNVLTLTLDGLVCPACGWTIVDDEQ